MLQRRALRLRRRRESATAATATRNVAAPVDEPPGTVLQPLSSSVLPPTGTLGVPASTPPEAPLLLLTAPLDDELLTAPDELLELDVPASGPPLEVPGAFTCWVKAAEVLSLKLLLPLYFAVIE
jgi:hypothetical protein